MAQSSPKDNFSVLIPDGESSFNLSVFRSLSKVHGLKVYILSDDPRALSRYSLHKAGFLLRKKSQNDKEWIDAIRQIVNQKNIDVVLPVDQIAIKVLSIYGKALLPTTAIAPLPTTKTFDIAADKWLSAEFFKKNNLPAPSTIRYESDEQFEQNITNITFPVLTKPVHGAGGNGIRFWEELPELRDYLKKLGDPQGFIIQSFIEGDNIDCSVLCQDGDILAYTIQKELFSARQRFKPATCIHFVHDEQVYSIVEQLMRTMKWSGIAHIDMLYDQRDKQFKILEINPRYWGSLLGSLSVGVNFPYLACLAGLNIKFPKPEYSAMPFIFIGGGRTMEILIRNILRKNNPAIRLNNTNFKYILQDPFATVAQHSLRF